MSAKEVTTTRSGRSATKITKPKSRKTSGSAASHKSAKSEGSGRSEMEEIDDAVRGLDQELDKLDVRVPAPRIDDVPPDISEDQAEERIKQLQIEQEQGGRVDKNLRQKAEGVGPDGTAGYKI